MKLFKIAVIGCGWVSMDCHGPSYARYAQTHPGVELAACCDVDARRADAFRERFGFSRAYTHYPEMLQDEKPDAVCLNVPPEAISDIGSGILEQGYPLLSEKPPGLTVEAVDQLISAARRSGAIHQVAFNRRFMPLVAELKQYLSGQPLQGMEILMARYRRLDPDFTTTAVHVIDLARSLLESDFNEIRFTYLPHEVAGQTVTDFLIEGMSRSGVPVRISIYPATGVTLERVTVYATDQTYFLGCANGLDAPGWLHIFRENQLAAQVDGAQLAGSTETYILQGFYAEDAAFFDAVQAGQQPREDLASARQSVEIMQAMRERSQYWNS